MIVKKEGHQHKYQEEDTKQILLSAGRKTALDIIYQRKCKCGAIQAYDLERKIQ